MICKMNSTSCVKGLINSNVTNKKKTITFRNVQFLSNKNASSVVIEIIGQVMGREITSADLVACHELTEPYPQPR